MCELPEVTKHFTRLVLQLGELVRCELITTEPVAGEPKPSDQGHHLLLDAVVQITLDPTPLRVLRGNEAHAGGRQLF